MLKITVDKKDLLRQLPQQAGYALLQWLDEMPKAFVFEGIEYENTDDKLQKELPHVFAALTLREWHSFSILHRAKGRVPRRALQVPDEQGLYAIESNVMDVHIKNLRAKIKRGGWPFEILTYRAGYGHQGSFELIKK